MVMHYILQAIFVIVGTFSLLAAIFNWNWFFNSHNSQFIVKSAGRKRARLFYALFGILMIATGINFFLSMN
jgi:hypothetical protein